MIWYIIKLYLNYFNYIQNNVRMSLTGRCLENIASCKYEGVWHMKKATIHNSSCLCQFTAT